MVTPMTIKNERTTLFLTEVRMGNLLFRIETEYTAGNLPQLKF